MVYNGIYKKILHKPQKIISLYNLIYNENVNYEYFKNASVYRNTLISAVIFEVSKYSLR